MSDTERLAALLRDEYELGDYWVSKSRLADAAYRGRDPMDDWRGLAARLVVAGVRVEDVGQEIHDVTCPDCARIDPGHTEVGQDALAAALDDALQEWLTGSGGNVSEGAYQAAALARDGWVLVNAEAHEAAMVAVEALLIANGKNADLVSDLVANRHRAVAAERARLAGAVRGLGRSVRLAPSGWYVSLDAVLALLEPEK